MKQYMTEEIYDYFEQLCFFADYQPKNEINTSNLDGENGIIFGNKESETYLESFRTEYGLDKFVSGNEVETVCRMARWVFEILLHSKYVEGTIDYVDSKDMIRKSRDDRIDLNCYCHAYILRDALQSVGIISRLIYCLPISCDYYANHVVVEFFCRCQNRWILVDPTYNVFFTDKDGTLLNIVQFRRKIIDQEDICVKNNSRFVFENRSDEEILLTYIKMMMPILVVLQYESICRHNIHHYRLIPDKYLLSYQQIKQDSISYIHSCESLYHR